MIYKNFKLNCIFRLLMISGNLFLIYYSASQLGYHITPILLIITSIIQFVSLFNYIQKINLYLTTFLESIRYADFSRSFQIDGLGSKYDELKAVFNLVINDFQKIRSDKEENYHYLQNVIQHIGIGLVAFTSEGDLEMINNSAKKLLQVHRLKNLSELAAINEKLPYTLLSLKSGDRTLIPINNNDSILQLAMYATEFKLRDRAIKLVSLQNIQSELEEQEMAAWQKLISVLTHEIMNSITPIASLSATVNHLLNEKKDKNNNPIPIDNETIDDIRSSLSTINKRSTGLIHFVESYRSLTKIPKPKFAIVPVNNIFLNIHNLLDEDIKTRNIRFNSKINPYSLELTVDQEQIEQVLLNMIKNSVHAVAECDDPHIELKAFLDIRGRIAIQITDNGAGILKDVIDKIFIPFFTTKSNGSGIGLSLSRQIMRIHGGSISVDSTPYVSTTFTLKF
ncbi:MAG: ATP-binding protein [Candidatus Cloacimonetes bacterium]|nr:ATP-binding protein [Candidatus Cloacimonadota bacterium]